MLRTGAGSLHKSTLSEILRLWFGGQPQCSLWHSSALLSKKKTRGHESSSDSDSDAAEPGDKVDEKLKKAAEGVARSVPKHGQAMQSDLLKQLQSFAKVSQNQAAGSSEAASKLSNLLSGMRVEKGPQRRREFDGDLMQKTRPKTGRLPVRRQQSHPDREKVKLFDGPGLGIFTTGDAAPADGGKASAAAEVVPQATSSLWERVQQEQLEVLGRRPPSNAFEEMIEWTKEGKLWQFPINNEQGMEEEARVGFHQHVFLEDQIRDFPRRGPVRHFMDLVLVGLSQNPYLSVQQKHEHIDWFRQYFRQKEDVLREALGDDGVMAPAAKSSSS
ncbi:small ribosomal subunit protein mS31-like [Babylonia areolata]|uniref:small ribosomal subunit protein mS31-like n=1 Tax=Babylonia areolata TaxID=304850 RepID=UPI003FCF9155